MSSFKTVRNYLGANGWRLVQFIDLGTTAHVFVIEKESKKWVLKTQRGEVAATRSLESEHKILRYLNETKMAQYVPRVGEWIHEVSGFLVEYLRYPTQAERETQGLLRTLAIALRTLHGLDLPSVDGIEDDRPFISTAMSCGFRDLFKVVLEDDSFWAGLPADDRPKLELVRARYNAYVGMLPMLETALADTECSLTHGDLSGDNIVMRQDNSLALVDWGEARTSSNLTDVAYLLTYAEWNQEDAQRFLRVYFRHDQKALEEALPAIDILSRLYQYRSCVRSLLWLNDLGADGLDSVGVAYFERQLSTL